MRSVLIFVFLSGAVFLAGALLAFPIHVCLGMIVKVEFQKTLHYSILLTGLILGLAYLHYTRQLAILFGRGRGVSVNLRQFSRGFLAGIMLLLAIELSLSLLGLRQVDPDLANGTIQLSIAVVKAVLTGLIVGLLEETLFRGAIYTGLARYSHHVTALFITALFYGAVHFIDFPDPPTGTAINWLTGVNVLALGFDRFTDIFILDSLMSLTLLGLLLGLMRKHAGNLILCTGLHAGIVTANKIFSYGTDYRPGSTYAFLVNIYDHQTGLLASFWLILALIIYYFLNRKNTV